jgi:hypothetical protein
MHFLRLLVGLVALVLLTATAQADSLWDHNGSTMRLKAQGASRFFFYETPRKAMADQGVRRGTLFFDGARDGSFYSGTARAFQLRCDAPMEFHITGSVVNEHLIVLEGERPVFRNCRPTGQMKHDSLVFTYLREAPEEREFHAEPAPVEPIAPDVREEPTVEPLVEEVVLSPDPAVLPADGKRVALVIGNGAYVHATELPNPRNDADAMAAMLQRLGFTVVVGTDLDKDSFETKIRDFARESRDAKLSLFFYAGHAIQVNGENYLVPVDAKVEDETALSFELVQVADIVTYVGGPEQVGIVLLDACRNNPFTRSLARSLRATREASLGRGLAPISTEGGGLLVGYATAPGDVAADGDGHNSPFTRALLNHLAVPGVEIEQAMKRVKSEVANVTKQDQRPWTNSDLTTEVFLLPVE